MVSDRRDLFHANVPVLHVSPFSSLVRFIYTASMSLRAPMAGEATTWLVYWVLFAIFAILESLTASFLY